MKNIISMITLLMSCGLFASDYHNNDQQQPMAMGVSMLDEGASSQAISDIFKKIAEFFTGKKKSEESTAISGKLSCDKVLALGYTSYQGGMSKCLAIKDEQPRRSCQNMVTDARNQGCFKGWTCEELRALGFTSYKQGMEKCEAVQNLDERKACRQMVAAGVNGACFE